MSGNIQQSFAYNGLDFSIIEDCTAVQVAGNAVVLWNTLKNQKDYIWSKKGGYCMATSNYNVGLVACAEYGLDPEVHIYRCIGGPPQLQDSFKMDTTVKCIGMAFSRCGKYLLMIGGVPDFRISIYDVEISKKLVIPETKLLCKPEEFLQAKFNPSNKSQFIILSQTTLYSYTINPAYDVTETGDQKILGEAFRLEHIEYKDENPDLTFGKLIWDQYGRVHICTDLNLMIMVNAKTCQLENTVNLSSRPCCALLTQKHMLVSLEEGVLNWYNLELPEVVLDKDADQSLKVTDEIDQDFSLNLTVGESDVPEYIAHMHYTKSFKTLIMGTETGVFGRLDVQAEVINYEEDEEEQNKEKVKKTIEVPFIELGRFHTKRVNGIKELGDSTQLITISEDHYMSVWEATTQKLLSTVYQPATPTSLEVATDGSAAFVGTIIGAFRAYDLTNRQRPRLVMQCRFFEEDVPINCISSSTDGKYILVSSNEKNIVYVLSGNPQEKFTVYGFIKFDGNVLSAAFHTDNGKLKILAVLENNLLAGADVPLQPVAKREIAIPADQANITYRKIDRNSNRVITNQQTKDIYITGGDKLLKRYEYPQEKVHQIDYKRAPMAPIEEHFSHSIGTTSFDYNRESKYLATGGRDGNILLRHTSDIGQEPTPIKAHSIFSGGVTALCFSKTMQMIYTAGGDGSFMIWSYGPNKGYPNTPVEVPVAQNGLADLPELQRVPANQIKVFSEILKDEFLKQQEGAKAQFKQVLMKDLSGISDKLLALLAENQRVTDIEKLERDEFVIDTHRRDKVNAEGEKECDEIRKEAEKTVQRLMLLRDRVQQSTYNTMLVQQKACKSISSDTLIWNYPVRKRVGTEDRRLLQIVNMRRMELIEKLDRESEKEKNKIQEALNESDFTAHLEDYLMNRVRGVPDYMDDDSIKQAAAEYLIKEMEKKARREKQDQSAAVAGNQQAGKGQARVPILKITKGKLGTKTKKKDTDDDDAARAAQGKKSDFERKEMSEMHWRIVYKLLENEKLLKNLQDGKEFKYRDLLYEPFELYTDIRKRNQIELIKAAVFELKEDFNEKFKALEDSKKNQIENIKEKNKMISEILENLGQEEELFVPQPHPLENPELILKVKESEVKVEKYLTKEERAILEEEQRKAAEREAALKGDNVGRRGLYTMMGGVELILKKEKNMMDQELVREDWMNKPVEEMTDEEKTKLKEFEQKEKEFKEKQRKAWEKDLLKIKQEIEEIHVKFDNELDELFKYKLFVDVRILEQELYLIRLVIMLHDGKETRGDEKKYRAEMERIEKEKAKKEEEINTFRGFAQDLDVRVNDDQVVKDQERELRKMFPEANNKQILQFVKHGKAKKTNIPGEVDPRKQQMLAQVVDLDPFEKIDKSRIDEILANEDEKEKYDFEKDGIPGLNEDDFDKLVQERQIRAEMDKQRQKQLNQITQLNEHINYLEDQLRDLDEKNEAQDLAQKKAAERILKIRYNYEVIVYLKQGLVEVPQLPVATDYKDAILVSKDVIAYENQEIITRGNKKVQLMNAISSFKTGLKQVRFQKKRLDLEIKDFEERAKDVQLYRVTKQTQEIIQGKHQKKDEEDKKRLENQIKQLEENAQKRIKNINETKLKLKKEIREKRLESDQLEARARQLQSNVDQRKQIMSLKSNTMTDGDADPSKKIKEIAHKRKLLDIAKQQTEEIEVLRDELDRLRARTFPSFAHLHNKPGYPDEN